MKPNLNNPYGYKICSQEQPNKPFETRFKVHSFRTASEIKKRYVVFQQYFKRRKVYHIYPISKQEVRQGIWRELPF